MKIIDLDLHDAIVEKIISRGYTGNGQVQELLIKIADKNNSVNVRMRRPEIIDLVRMLSEALNADRQWGYTDFTLTDEQRQGDKVN